MPTDPRVVRNRLLKILHRWHPEWVDDEVLMLGLGDMNVLVPLKDLVSELVYLRDWPEKDHGYVELRTVTTVDGELGQSRITPRGINLVERAIAADPMIAPF